ncbi:hypothetical protein FOXYSP1_08643 [Fusarium oxysporum f. sp. phaseoli]
MTNPTMASRFRGDGEPQISCNRCINCKQTCDPALPLYSRCTRDSYFCCYKQPEVSSPTSIQFEDPPPPARSLLLSLGCCGWDVTKHGQSELMQAMLDHRHPFDG